MGKIMTIAFLLLHLMISNGAKNILMPHREMFSFQTPIQLSKKTNMEICLMPIIPKLHDLALLINCNHTIVSRGTFSLWVAHLAGGEYYTEYGAIVPPHLRG